jgi:voltage-gated potassium channel
MDFIVGFDFTIDFLVNLGRLLLDGLPLFIGLSVIVSALSAVVGRKESWSVSESLYFGFITALTVGYGDMRPSTGLGRFLAVVIAVFGLITTGIVVAIAVETADLTFHQRQAAGL